MNGNAIDSIRPWNEIFYEGVMIEGWDADGNQLIRPAHKKEQPDLWSVYIKEADGSVRCVADFDEHTDAINMVALVNKLIETCIR
jgi:hypothetical protein